MGIHKNCKFIKADEDYEEKCPSYKEQRTEEKEIIILECVSCPHAEATLLEEEL